MIKLKRLVDDSFQSQTAAKCDLLIHIGFETFQYVIIDKVRDELKAIAEYQLPAYHSMGELISAIEKLPESNLEFKYPYNKIRISFDSYKYTFIPENLFEQEYEQEYAKFVNQSASDNTLINNIKSAKIKNIFAINSDVNSSLNRIFRNPKIYNQASPFIEGVKKTNTDNNSNTLFIDCHSQHIQIAYLKKNELVFYNILECLNADEFNYFILNTINSLNLELDQTKVIISGKVASTEDEYFKRLIKYFNTPIFADSRLIVKHAGIFNDLPSQTFFPLMSLDLCE